VFLSVIEARKAQKVCGIHCLPFIVNVRFATPIFGMPMGSFFLPIVTALWVNIRAKQILWNDLIVP
jgi:hypothetical protein